MKGIPLELNGMGFCCMFCFMPILVKIVSKYAFHPPAPSYYVISNKGNPKAIIKLNDQVDWSNSSEYLSQCEFFFALTSRGSKIACLMYRNVGETRFTILFSHGNAVDIGIKAKLLFLLGKRYSCNIFSYDYSGYGLSTGKASEKNLYSDIECAWSTLIKRCGIKQEEVILYGHSIGTVPTIYLASKEHLSCNVKGVILQSPLASGMKVALPDFHKRICVDVFLNIDRIHKVAAPVLIIHGKKDKVIHVSQGKELYKRCKNSVDPLWLEEAEHNDIELYEEYYERLHHFLTVELLKPPSLTTATI